MFKIPAHPRYNTWLSISATNTDVPGLTMNGITFPKSGSMPRFTVLSRSPTFSTEIDSQSYGCARIVNMLIYLTVRQGTCM